MLKKITNDPTLLNTIGEEVDFNDDESMSVTSSLSMESSSSCQESRENIDEILKDVDVTSMKKSK